MSLSSGNILSSFSKSDMLRKLIYINLGIFILISIVLAFVGFSGNEALLNTLSPDLFLGSTHQLGGLIYRPWSVVTYMFTHYDLWHIFSNLLVLYFVGTMFQQIFGQRRLLSTYILGGLFGYSFFFIVYNLFPVFDVESNIVGASAAVMAILVGLATYLPEREVRLILLGTIKLKYIAGILVLLDVLALESMQNTGGHLGHLGGAFWGFIWAYQYRTKNKDLASGFEKFLDGFFNLFSSSGTKFRVIRNKEKPVNEMSDAEYNLNKKAKQQRIDAILDKISKAGYDSLTKEEKEFLFKNSKR